MFRPGSVFKNVRNETKFKSVQKIDIIDSNVFLKRIYITHFTKIFLQLKLTKKNPLITECR